MTIYGTETYWSQKNKEILLVVTEKTGHEVNAEKPMHIFMSCEENAVEIHHVTVSNKSFMKYNKSNFCGHNTNKSNLQSQVN